MNPADPLFAEACRDVEVAEALSQVQHILADKLATVLADKWAENGLLKRWLDQYLDELLDAEEIEFSGRWCDDGGRAEEDEP